MEQGEEIDKQGLSEESHTNITSYQIRPTLGDIFKGSQIKDIIREIMFEKLHGKQYNAEHVKQWTKDIADSINTAIKDRLIMPRYKHVVQVMLGQQLGAGCHYYCKCCWDAESDSQTSDVFTNASIFCVTTVFGVYLY